jgi:hypothetical protein
MKTLYFSICCILCLTTLSTAQEQSLNEFVRDYHHRDGIKHFTIPGFLVRLAGNIVLNDEDRLDREALRPLIRNIGGVSILLANEGHRIGSTDLKRLKAYLLDENYEPLVTIRDEDSTVEIFSWEKKDITRRLIFIIHDDDDESLLVTVRGYFTPEDISKLINHYKNKDKLQRL